MEEIKILIIEDEQKIARFLELHLTHEGYKVHWEDNGQSGFEEALAGDYSLILLDILLPGLNGIEVCRRIRRKSDVPIIMLTAKDDTADIVVGLDNGANDYVTKPFSIKELTARIRKTLKNIDTIKKESDELMGTGDLSVHPTKRVVKRGNKPIELRRLEFDLLLYLIQNKGAILTREQILENVWGFDYTGETNVIDVHINSLRNKIDRSHKNKLIKTVWGIGYSIKDEGTAPNE
jgi:Response regulators consisting of a CheY-like receiver domain and a winged-helix DNA-binding domain